MTPRQRQFWLTGQALVTVVLLALLARRLDLHALAALFAALPVWLYVASLAVVTGGLVAYAWRWRVLLAAAGVDVPLATVIRQYFIGVFLNNFLPSTVGGDLAKVYLLGRERGYRTVTASVLLDRILGLGTLAAFAFVLLMSLPVRAPVLILARAAVGVLTVVSSLVLGVIVCGTGGLPTRLRPMGDRAVTLAHQLQRLRGDMAAALRRPIVIGTTMAVVAGYFLAVGGIYVAFIRSHLGTAPPFAELLAVAAATAVLSNVPISLNGLGVREQLHVILLAPLGVPREVAVAISLLLWAQLLVASLLGLVFWLSAPAIPADAAAHLET